MQEQKLRYNEKQEEQRRTYRASEVLQILQEAYLAQGNKVIS
jgi:hypothetical protein